MSYQEQITELEQTIERKDGERKELQEVIAQQQLRYESLRDPTGLQHFKRLINGFNDGLDTILDQK